MLSYKAVGKIIYATTNEVERDDFHNNYASRYVLSNIAKKNIVADLDLVAQETWNTLNALEKLSLERVDCVIWLQKSQSKYSV